jgi:hypothetical protein
MNTIKRNHHETPDYRFVVYDKKYIDQSANKPSDEKFIQEDVPFKKTEDEMNYEMMVFMEYYH